MNAMSSRMMSGIGANRWPVCTITSMGWLVLPNIAMLASPDDGLLPALEGAGLAVGLHRRDDLLRHLLEVGDLVEADDVPDLHHALLAARHVTEEVGDRRAAREQRRVRRHLLDDVALARSARTELDEVVVALGERDEAHEEEQLQPPRHLGRLVAHAAHDEVEPLVGRELAADAPVLLEVEGRDLDRRELVDPERVLALRLLVVLEAHVDLRPDAAHDEALVVADVVLGNVHVLVPEVRDLGPVVRVDEAHLHLVDEGVTPAVLDLAWAFIDSSERM